MKTKTILLPILLLGLFAIVPITPAAPITNLAELRAERARLAGKPGRLIMNNDGCDCLYFPRSLAATPENFLKQRTTDLAGTQVDGIAYCSISSGFGQFTHDNRTGAILEHSASDFGIAPDKRNIARDLIDLGQDPLRLVAGFCRTNDLECFWSIRLNDTHDAAHRHDKPYFLFPKLKEQHPEWLVGPQSGTPYGRWSSVNYALPAVRDYALANIREVCRNYDVTGIEMDYFRHLCYLPSVAKGGKSTQEERAKITDFMRRVRKMTEEEGLRRGRPFLVSVRTPDSADFCRELGLDVEQWMRERLIDILIPSGYFRLHEWSHSIAWGRRHGVRVYPCLTDTRVRSESRFRRMSIESYRARAANAWAAGADGLQLFNQFNPKSPVWRELGDPATLRFLDKLHFVTTADGVGTRWLADGERFRTRPLLSPTRPMTLRLGETNETYLHVSDDLAAARKAGRNPVAKLHLELPDVDEPKNLRLALNGKALRGGRLKNGWLDIAVTEQLRVGKNHLSLALNPAEPPAESEWSLTFDGTSAPQRPWYPDRGSERIFEKHEGNAFLIADRGTVSGDYRYYRHAWGADSKQECVIEARMKVVSGVSHLIFSNGRSADRLRLEPGLIRLYHNSSLRSAMDTTDRFHEYRIEMKGEDLRVFVDGKLRIDATGRFKPQPRYRNEIAFGSANSSDLGEAWWQSVKVRAARGTRLLRDVVVSVKYSQKK
ncbi:MAG: hypothetical protein CMO80_07520 [Verrucomicrobiales bacterium]|nr:hypothetical protein [Verrucomicrobiales bacterium]